MSQDFDLFGNINDFENDKLTINESDISLTEENGVSPAARKENKNKSDSTSESLVKENITRAAARAARKLEAIERKSRKQIEGNGRKGRKNATVTASESRSSIAVPTSSRQDLPSHVHKVRRQSRTSRQNLQNSEVIDLVSSPKPATPVTLITIRPNETISLEDSDEESLSKLIASPQTNSFDSKNYEISIKVNWMGEIERIPYRKYQKFAEMIRYFAKKVNADPKTVILNFGERIIRDDDTPNSIGYDIVKFLSGRIITDYVSTVILQTYKPPIADGLISVKVQSNKWKKPLIVSIDKTSKLNILFIKLAEEIKCPPQNIKLRFDGDDLDRNSTAADLEFEGGEILDCLYN